MKVKFIHTADWQIGKPYGSIDDTSKKHLLQQERLQAIGRIGKIARDEDADFILVAGDLFDSPTVTKSTVSAACSAIGALKIPVYIISGNHDHGGPGSIWEQEFFRRQHNELAPNLHILLKYEPFETEKAVIFPCPLLRRHESIDVTSWLQSFDFRQNDFGAKPRIVLAHGSVTDFGGMSDDEEIDATATNYIDWQRIPDNEIDFIALGDWHGTKEIDKKVWYSGTPEFDRFIKSEEHNPGNVLVICAERNSIPEVKIVQTNKINWHELEFHFGEDSDLNTLEQKLSELVKQRSNEDLLKLVLNGFLGLNAYSMLEQRLESLSARLVRLKLTNNTTISPTEEEILELANLPGSKLVPKIASVLIETANSATGNEQAIARIALRQLYSLSFSS